MQGAYQKSQTCPNRVNTYVGIDQRHKAYQCLSMDGYHAGVCTHSIHHLCSCKQYSTNGNRFKMNVYHHQHWVQNIATFRRSMAHFVTSGRRNRGRSRVDHKEPVFKWVSIHDNNAHDLKLTMWPASKIRKKVNLS